MMEFIADLINPVVALWVGIGIFLWYFLFG